MTKKKEERDGSFKRLENCFFYVFVFPIALVLLLIMGHGNGSNDFRVHMWCGGGGGTMLITNMEEK